MATKTRWANIVCNEKMQPYLLIITDGEWETQVPISNTRLETVKKATKNMYDVPPRRMLVTQVFGNDNHKKG